MRKISIIIAAICMSTVVIADDAKPQDFASHIKDGRICGPVSLQDKTGGVMFSLGEGQCMGLNWKPHTSRPAVQIPSPNIQ